MRPWRRGKYIWQMEHLSYIASHREPSTSGVSHLYILYTRFWVYAVLLLLFFAVATPPLPPPSHTTTPSAPELKQDARRKSCCNDAECYALKCPRKTELPTQNRLKIIRAFERRFRSSSDHENPMQKKHAKSTSGLLSRSRYRSNKSVVSRSEIASVSSLIILWLGELLLAEECEEAHTDAKLEGETDPEPWLGKAINPSASEVGEGRSGTCTVESICSCNLYECQHVCVGKDV